LRKILIKKKRSGWDIQKNHQENPEFLYNEAVEEALCFGWIDSIVKTLDDDRSAQRFSPRDPKSTFSQANKERLKWLL
jgi:uncharacterized protein YdeI (YjbR/CyaY-like superfamily)